MPFLSAMRDKAILVAARNWLKSKTGAVKDVRSLEIDTKQKTFSLELDLAGETEPLKVTGNYQLVSGAEKTMVTPADIKTSREWLTILAADFVNGRPIEVPGIVGSFL